MFKAVLDVLTNLFGDKFSQHPLYSFLIACLLCLITIAVYLGNFSGQIATQFSNFETQITVIDQSFRELHDLIDKKTVDRYTKQEADIQIKAYDTYYQNLRDRIENLEQHCFNKK